MEKSALRTTGLNFKAFILFHFVYWWTNRSWQRKNYPKEPSSFGNACNLKMHTLYLWRYINPSLENSHTAEKPQKSKDYGSPVIEGKTPKTLNRWRWRPLYQFQQQRSWSIKFCRLVNDRNRQRAWQTSQHILGQSTQTWPFPITKLWPQSAAAASAVLRLVFVSVFTVLSCVLTLPSWLLFTQKCFQRWRASTRRRRRWLMPDLFLSWGRGKALHDIKRVTHISLGGKNTNPRQYIDPVGPANTMWILQEDCMNTPSPPQQENRAQPKRHNTNTDVRVYPLPLGRHRHPAGTRRKDGGRTVLRKRMSKSHRGKGKYFRWSSVVDS